MRSSLLVLPLLVAFACATLVGCGNKAAPSQALTAEQERQRTEHIKQVEQEERAHQEQVQRTEGPPRR